MEDLHPHSHSHSFQNSQVLDAQSSWQQTQAALFVERHPDLSASYPSPASSIESPHFIHLDSFPQQHSPPLSTIPSSFPQLDSSIGPARPLTRQRRPPYHLPTRRSSMPLPSAFPRTEHDHVPRHHSAMYLGSSALESRPQSPSCKLDFNQSLARDRLSLNMETVPGMPMQSAAYHPLTPSSSASSFSPYQLYPTHSRSNSESTMIGRDPSPALSNASVPTSVSSSGSIPHHHHHQTSYYPRPASDHILQHSSQPQRPKQRKQRLVNAQRKQICLDHLANDKLRQEDIAARYGVERSTVSKILKSRTKWLSLPDNDDMRTAKHRPSKFPEIEEQLLKWLEDCKAKSMSGHLSDASIRTKAKEVARSLEIGEDKFKASSGWVENFKQRHGIRGGNWHGDGRNTVVGRPLTANYHVQNANHGQSSLVSSLHPVNTRQEPYTMSQNSPPVNPLISSPQTDESMDQCHGDTSMNSISLQTAWSENATGAIQNNGQSSREVHEALSGPTVMPHPQINPTTTSPQPQHAPELDGQGGLTYPTTEYESMPIYQPAPRMADNSPPTLANAEEAFDRVLLYLDTIGQGLIQPQEREVLDNVKVRLFQAASGMPFDRRTA